MLVCGVVPDIHPRHPESMNGVFHEHPVVAFDSKFGRAEFVAGAKGRGQIISQCLEKSVAQSVGARVPRTDSIWAVPVRCTGQL